MTGRRLRRSGQSRPARGAWIEIRDITLKHLSSSGRAPQGARGLKFEAVFLQNIVNQSRPARGAWIEIRPCWTKRAWTRRSRPARGAWIEICFLHAHDGHQKSRPARGAAKESPILFSAATCVEENISRPATVRAAGRQVFRQNHTGAVTDRPGALYSRGRVPRCARQICSSTSLASWYAMSAL